MTNPQDAPADVRLERDSTFASLEEIVDAAQDYAVQAFGDSGGDAAHRFVLAVSEAVTNAIEHGNVSNPQKQVVVEFRTKGERVEALVTDQGSGFDPTGVEDPLDDSNLRRTHGRGLHIIHQVASQVQYEADGRCVRMTFRREA